MDAVFLQGIIDLYGGGRESVQVMNAQWEIVWSEGTVRIPDLRERLSLARDWWGKPIHCLLESGDTLLRCTIRCSEQNGLRVATYLPVSADLLADRKSAAEIMQQVIGAGNLLFQALEEQEMYEQRGNLNRMISAFLKIYRSVYLHSLLESCVMGGSTAQELSLYTFAEMLKGQMQSILGNAMQVEVVTTELYCVVKGSAEILPSVLVAAVLCCIRQPEQCQSLQLSIWQAEGAVTLQIAVTPLETPLPSSQRALGMTESDVEYQLIEAYCRMFSCTMEESEQDGAHVMRLTMPTAASDDKWTLHNSLERGEMNYFDPIRVMLAPFGYRDYF
ncbi:MAG: hypothetical protein II916_01180 [Oscillospiraceae bacterium]|nr:hypothetical protein [Oscillospiraceae bacterium]